MALLTPKLHIGMTVTSIKHYGKQAYYARIKQVSN